MSTHATPGLRSAGEGALFHFAVTAVGLGALALFAQWAERAKRRHAA